MNNIRVGCCGFPVNREKYFKKFELVEIQSTFYQPMDIEKAGQLREEANSIKPDFEFSVKAFQVITHPMSSPTYKKLKKPFGKAENFGYFKSTKEVYDAYELTREIAHVLNAKIILFQTPPSFGESKENIENLTAFFHSIKREFVFVWEPRGLWSSETLKHIAEETKLVIGVDPFKGKAFGELNYFRLHGLPGYNLRYKYSYEDFSKLANFCDKKENYVLFNNLNMLEDSLSFISFLKKRQVKKKGDTGKS